MRAARESAPAPKRRGRLRVAFFDYPDVFEDFYPHYGVSQHAFATEWAGSGSHAILELVQREIADVLWYEFSLAPELSEARHARLDGAVPAVVGAPSRPLARLLPAPHRLAVARGLSGLLADRVVRRPAVRAVLRALERDRPDVLFAQDYATGRFDVLALVARRLGIPLVAYHSGSQASNHQGRLVKRWSLREAACLLVTSADEAGMLAGRYGVAHERLVPMLTPIDTTAFHPRDRSAALRNAGLDPARRYLLCVGRLETASSG